MTDEQHRKWDIIIKGVITPLIAVVTVFVGIFQYTDGQKKSLEREYELRRAEHQERMLMEKTALYRETRQILSFLSTNDDDGSVLFKSKKNRFWELYWGDLAAVEGPEIESMMVQFGRSLDELENQRDEEKRREIKNTMEQISLALARQTGHELKEEP